MCCTNFVEFWLASIAGLWWIDRYSQSIWTHSKRTRFECIQKGPDLNMFKSTLTIWPFIEVLLCSTVGSPSSLRRFSAQNQILNPWFVQVSRGLGQAFRIMPKSLECIALVTQVENLTAPPRKRSCTESALRGQDTKFFYAFIVHFTDNESSVDERQRSWTLRGLFLFSSPTNIILAGRYEQISVSWIWPKCTTVGYGRNVR